MQPPAQSSAYSATALAVLTSAPAQSCTSVSSRLPQPPSHWSQVNSCHSLPVLTLLITVKFPGYGPPETRNIGTETRYLSLTRSGQKLYVPEVQVTSLLGGDTDPSLLYFVLPESHAGNLLKSYGAQIRFNINFSSGSGAQTPAPMIIIVVSYLSYT